MNAAHAAVNAAHAAVSSAHAAMNAAWVQASNAEVASGVMPTLSAGLERRVQGTGHRDGLETVRVQGTGLETVRVQGTGLETVGLVRLTKPTEGHSFGILLEQKYVARAGTASASSDTASASSDTASASSDTVSASSDTASASSSSSEGIRLAQKWGQGTGLAQNWVQGAGLAHNWETARVQGTGLAQNWELTAFVKAFLDRRIASTTSDGGQQVSSAGRVSSARERDGLHVGDCILAVNGVKVCMAFTHMHAHTCTYR